MIVLYVILGLLGYILVASLVSGIYRNVLNNGEEALWTGAMWPVTVPFIIVWALFLPIIYSITWLSGKISDFIQKYILKKEKKEDLSGSGHEIH